MRPILTLKKKPAPAPLAPVTPDVEPAVPVDPPQPAQAVKPVKPSPKEAQTAANRLLNEEQRARRLAHSEKVKPLVEAYCSDQALFRETVLVDGVECFRPLAIGVHKTILAWLRQQPEALGCSNTLLIDLIKAALGPHVAKPPYLAGLLKFQDRFDLDGNVVGVVEDKHRARAEKAFRKISANAAKSP